MLTGEVNREEKDDTVVHIRSFDTCRPYIDLVRRSGIHAAPNSNPSSGHRAGATRPTHSGSGARTGSYASSYTSPRPHAGGYPDGHTP